MIWSEVQITTTPEAEDAVAEAFYSAGAGGVAIESALDIEGLWGDPLVGYIDDSLLNRPKNTSLVRGYFPVGEEGDEKIREILLRIAQLPEYGLNPGSGELQIVEVQDEDWANSWKKYFFATNITDRITVVPSWENYKPSEDEITVLMDPGMAFGTGTHETTQLCAELLEKACKPDSFLIDVGTGTGILSIIAAKLGVNNILATDFDPVAVRVAQENIEKNNVSDQIKVQEANLLSNIELDKSPDIVVANILPDPLIQLTPQVAELLHSNGVFILSGIIKEALPEVVDALEENAFNILNINYKGEWAAIAAIKL